MGLAGFGLEGLADVTRGGAWHIGVPRRARHPRDAARRPRTRIPRAICLPDHDRAVQGAITATDIEEFARTYARPDGRRGAIDLYQSIQREGADIKTLAETRALRVPVFAVGPAEAPLRPASCPRSRRRI